MYKNKNSQSGEVVTLISVITLVALTIFTAFSSQFIAQKQTTNTKAEDYLGCSCGEETDYSVCNQYGTQQVITGYNQVCTDWDEYNECIASGDDYNDPIYEDDVDYSNCIEYGKKCIACTDNNEDYQTQNTDEQCECLNGYYTDACGVDAAGTYCGEDYLNNDTSSQDEQCECLNGYYTDACGVDAAGTYCGEDSLNNDTSVSCSNGVCETENYGCDLENYDQVGTCSVNGINGVCCKEKNLSDQITENSCEQNGGYCIDVNYEYSNSDVLSNYQCSDYTQVCIKNTSNVSGDYQCSNDSSCKEYCDSETEEQVSGECSVNGVNGICCKTKESSKTACSDLGGECVNSSDSENNETIENGYCDNEMVCIKKNSGNCNVVLNGNDGQLEDSVGDEDYQTSIYLDQSSAECDNGSDTIYVNFYLNGDQLEVSAQGGSINATLSSDAELE